MQLSHPVHKLTLQAASTCLLTDNAPLAALHYATRSFIVLVSEYGQLRALTALFLMMKDETGAWDRRLAVLTEGLQNLNTLQRKWVYLEPIFARGALPNEQPRFRRVLTDAQ